MNQTSNIFTQVYSVLENGIRIPCALEIGSFYQTQWGARKVVSRYVETFSLDRNEPEGVWTPMNEFELAEIFVANNFSRFKTNEYLKQNQIPLPSPRVFFWAELIAQQIVCHSQRNWDRRDDFDCRGWRRARLSRNARRCRGDLQSFNLAQTFANASLLAKKTVLLLERQRRWDWDRKSEEAQEMVKCSQNCSKLRLD